MEQLDLGLILGGLVVAAFLGGGGYVWAHSDHLLGGEPPQWLTMTPDQQAKEREMALVSIHALGAHWRRSLIIGAVVSAAGLVLVPVS